MLEVCHEKKCYEIESLQKTTRCTNMLNNVLKQKLSNDIFLKLINFS